MSAHGPVVAGDTLLKIRTIGRHRRGETVCPFKRGMLIPCAGHAVEDRPGFC